MTIVGLIPLPTHLALRMASGLLTMLVGFLAGFGALATVLAVIVGALVTGVALSAVVEDRERGPLPVATLHTLDYGLVLGLMLVALTVAAAGDATAGAVLAGIAVVQLTGNMLTKYSLSA